MDDATIVELYWQRNQQAIAESERKYGKYCHAIALNILSDIKDAEECVNDTWLGAWNAIPDARPNSLGAFLSRITRNISLNRLSSQKRKKRGGGESVFVLEELTENAAYSADVTEIIELQELSAAIDRFLSSLPKLERNIFLSRYWAFASIREIAKAAHWSESKTKSTLFRIRKKLRVFLKNEGLSDEE